MTVEEVLRGAGKILTECAIAERLRRRDDVALHPTLFNTPLIYDEAGRAAMTEIYEQYLAIAREAKLPLLLCAPTWRLDRDRIAAAAELGEPVPATINGDAVAFMQGLRAVWSRPESPVYVGALMGPRNDCYKPEEALDEESARAFHETQAKELAAAGAELVVAQTMPHVGEARGLARAVSAEGLPVLVSFVIGKDGRVLDGHSLAEAIAAVDSLDPQPIGVMTNCSWPGYVPDALLEAPLNARYLGMQANASSREAAALDGSATLEQDRLETWLAGMARLHRGGVRLLGGCCGTDDRYLRGLAEL